MAGEGKWTLQERMRRCGGPRLCRACAADAAARPHGPYYTLRRRHPETGEQEAVYIGTTPVPVHVLAIVNEIFDGPDAPTKEEVLMLVEAKARARGLSTKG